jgi:drug/metabolite transporter (DMT)-like permease
MIGECCFCGRRELHCCANRSRNLLHWLVHPTTVTPDSGVLSMRADNPKPVPLRLTRRERTTVLLKTAIVSLIVIATNVIGNYGLTRGMHQVGVVESWSPLPYIAAFAHPWVAIGVVFMIGWLVSRLALLSWADLSYVLPVTSLSYALSALAGAFYLHEKVSALQWGGIAVITLGAGLVALTFPESNTPGHNA